MRKLTGTVTEKRGRMARIKTDAQEYYLSVLYIVVTADVQVGDRGDLEYVSSPWSGLWQFSKKVLSNPGE